MRMVMMTYHGGNLRRMPVVLMIALMLIEKMNPTQ